MRPLFYLAKCGHFFKFYSHFYEILNPPFYGRCLNQRSGSQHFWVSKRIRQMILTCRFSERHDNFYKYFDNFCEILNPLKMVPSSSFSVLHLHVHGMQIKYNKKQLNNTMYVKKQKSTLKQGVGCTPLFGGRLYPTQTFSFIHE